MKMAKKDVAPVAPAENAVTITPARFETRTVFIRGTAPLVIHKFSAKAIKQIRDKQEAGSTAKKGKAREAKDFEAAFNGARHVSFDGWDGIPAAAFRCAMISACRLVGFKMTLAKLSLFVEADGFDATEGTPLVRILGEPPMQFESMVRINNGASTDIAVRPLYRQWGAKLRIKYDADQFNDVDVANLLTRVGMQIGICEGRPDSKNSAGMGWGTFELVTEKDMEGLC